MTHAVVAPRRRRAVPVVASLLGLAGLAVGAHAAPDAPAGPLYLTAAEVFTGSGPVYRPGAVAVVDGKIAAVGRPADVPVPRGARRLAGAAILPGLVVAESEHTAKGDADPNSVAPDVRAIDGYDFAAPEARLLAAGVTTVFLSPGSNRVVTGRGAVVRTAGASRESRTLRADAGLCAGVGESVLGPPLVIDPPVEPDATEAPIRPWRRQFPVTRAGSLMLLRDAIPEGAEVRIGAETAGDLEAALGFAKERRVRAVLVGARDANVAAASIAASQVPVVLTWPLAPGRVASPADADTERALLAARRNAAVLSQAGVPFALAPSAESSLPDLLFVAASAAREGLSAEECVAAITSRAASILGVGDRVGSIEVGRDADLAVLSGSPVDPRTFATATIVEGSVAWERRASSRVVVVRAAEIHVGDGRVIAPGEIAFDDGKILEVGPTVGIPPGARFIDVGAGSVTPGFVDAFSRAGLAGEGGRAAGDLSTATTAAKAVTPGDPSFAILAQHGVTTALVAPGAGGRVGGRAAVVKTSGADAARRVVDADAGLVVRLRGDRDVAAAVKELDDLLKKAKEYKESFEKYEKDKKEWDAWRKAKDEEDAKKKAAAEKPKDEPKKDEAKTEPPKEEKPAEKKDEKPADKKEEKKEEPKPADEKEEPRKPKTDEALAGWLPALTRKAPVFVAARTVEEIRAALTLLDGDWKLRVVLVGADDVRRVVPLAEKAKAGVIAGPVALVEEKGRPVNLLRELALTGLPAAIGSDSWLGGAELPEVIGYAVARGLSAGAAVRMLTGDAAKLLAIDVRTGTLAAGKDADLVLFSGAPFGAGSRVLHVFAEGEEVPLGAR